MEKKKKERRKPPEKTERKLDKVRALQGGREKNKSERAHAGWKGTSLLEIVSHNKKLVGLKRKVCRLGKKLCGAGVHREIFP